MRGMIALISSALGMVAVLGTFPLTSATAAEICFSEFTPGTFTVREVTRIFTGSGTPDTPCSFSSRFTGTLPGSTFVDSPFGGFSGFSDLTIGPRNGLTGEFTELSFDEDVGLGRRSTSAVTVRNEGIWELGNDADLFDLGGDGIPPRFINNNIFRKSSGGGVSNVSVNFQSIGGRIEVLEGSLVFSGPSTSISQTEMVKNGGKLGFSGDAQLSLLDYANSGVLEVNEGELRLSDVTISNGSGQINIGSNGSLRGVSSSDNILGGAIHGEVGAQLGGVLLEDVTTTGRLIVAGSLSSASPQRAFRGTITNEGELVSNVVANGSSSYRIDGNGAETIFEGNGRFVFSQSEGATGQSLIIGSSIEDSTLVNGLNHSLVVEGNGEGRTVAQLNSLSVVNKNLISVNGGELRLADVEVDNVQGRIDIGQNSSIVGNSTISTQIIAGGTVHGETGATIERVQLQDLETTGTINIIGSPTSDFSPPPFIGTITNEGDLVSNIVSNFGQSFRIDGAVGGIETTLEGSGRLVFSQGEGATGSHFVQGSSIENSTLVNGSNHSIGIEGNGDNRRVASLSGMTVANTGSFLVENARLDLSNVVFANSGSLDVSNDSRVQGSNASIVQSGGNLNVDGVLVANSVNIDAGTLTGSGLLDTDLTVGEGASVNPGNSPGTLAVDGDFALETGATLFLEVEGTQLGEFDRLLVSGDLALNGDIVFGLTQDLFNGLFEQAFTIDDFILDFNPSTLAAFAFVERQVFEDASFFVQFGNSLYDLAFLSESGSFEVGDQLSTVDLPESIGSLVLGLGVLGFVRSRQRRLKRAA
ncbi:hypothetical protein EOI86_16135 [Hwanghaeella grinnelliae]|uniref:PEP-CTERM sorting domain-containing protein n=1 Tax=Hwanghaeella grinnelliae TaxID=2500179 RepID=A0A437QQA9_9PROT|nr:hypothetical protein [Hwanghaeella grinnelliae]RVU36702.1 hypothetical protein EOI86_16135 [Hwanghaeella grinnelliae]